MCILFSFASGLYKYIYKLQIMKFDINLRPEKMLLTYPPLHVCTVLYLYKSHHDSCQQANPLPAVGVRDHVAVADGQEGDGDQPHCSKEGAGHLLCIVIPAET